MDGVGNKLSPCLRALVDAKLAVAQVVIAHRLALDWRTRLLLLGLVIPVNLVICITSRQGAQVHWPDERSHGGRPIRNQVPGGALPPPPLARTLEKVAVECHAAAAAINILPQPFQSPLVGRAARRVVALAVVIGPALVQAIALALSLIHI